MALTDDEAGELCAVDRRQPYQRRQISRAPANVTRRVGCIWMLARPRGIPWCSSRDTRATGMAAHSNANAKHMPANAQARGV